MLDFNTEPYNDDFDENKKFYRILFRPGFAVQARELTQLQTILQNQISRQGNHLFKEGSMVIPGQISLDTKYNYVKLQIFNSAGDITESFVKNLAGANLVGTSGVTAQVLNVVSADGADPTTLYVKYTSSGTDKTTSTFSDGEVLTTDDSAYTVTALTTNAVGIGSSATIERGVYFIKGFFVLCDQQTILLDKYTNSPSYRVGLSVTETKLTPEDTGYEQLLDNAQNSFNYAAPGAHRYFIDLTLTKIPLLTDAFSWAAGLTVAKGNVVKNNDIYYQVTVAGNLGSSAPSHTSGSTSNGTSTLQFIQIYTESTDTNSDSGFIELLSTAAGQVKREVTRSSYAEIEKTLARRTYDESGNYITKPFTIEVREYRNNERKQWTQGTSYLIGDVVTNSGITYVAKNSATSGIVPPTHTSGIVTDGNVNWEYNMMPYYNRGVYTPSNSEDITVNQENEAKLAIGLEPGKAYVQGFEIEKIATEYVTIDKARTYNQVNNSYLSTKLGNFIYVTNLNSLPPFDASTGCPNITIYNRFTSSVGVAPTSATAIGTARVRGIEFDSGTPGSQTAIYKLYLFDISVTAGYDISRDAKCFYYSRSDSNLNFTADIKPMTLDLVGSATTYTSYPTKGASTTLTGIGSAWKGGTLTSPLLKVGDYIYVGSSSNIRRVVTVTSNGVIVVDSSVTVDGGIISLVTTKVQEPANNSLLFSLPNYAIKSVRDANNSNQIIYYTMKYISASTGSSIGGGQCELTINSGGGVFAETTEIDNYILMYNDSSSGGAVIAPISASGAGTTQVKFVLSDSYANKNFTVMATIKKIGTDGGEKTKTLQTITQTYTTQASATNSIISLGKADIFRIKSITMDTGSFTAPTGTYGFDIYDRYDFDNGQRDEYYDVGRLFLKHSYSPPSAPISVEFEYFSHGGSGDYFTINSYGTQVRVNDIPSYNGLSLRDVLDFRPRIADAGDVFTSTGSSFSLTPKRGQDITVSYSYYLPRKDKIAISQDGVFFDVSGVPALAPGEPLDPAVGMVLYKLTLEPYTFGTTNSNVIIDQIDNKRYTMRDIGNLEKRIDNLEYYTSLTLLEQETKGLPITDANGLDRFKNGFIVDSFTGHNVGNVLSPDYLCSVDMQAGELRPFYNINNVNLIESISSDSDRTTAGYKVYGDVITLPVIDHVPIVKQIYASRLENINPFAIFTFLGDIKLNPSSDDWFETQRAPDIIRNVEGNFNTIAALATEAGILGTIWNAWQINWIGQPVPSGGGLIQYTTGVNWASRGYMADATGANVGTGAAIYIDVGEFNNRFGALNAGHVNARQVFVSTEAQTISRSRQGVKSTLAVQMERQVIDDKIISTTLIPYIRKRNILVQVKKLKPNTTFYPYFDNIDVKSYCTPSSTITYTLPTATSTDFETSKNSGSLAADPARTIDATSGVFNSDYGGNMCLNIGDVITGQSSGATAVVVGREYDSDSGIRKLHVMNVKGTFTVNETILGSISGAQGTVTVREGNRTQGGNLITNGSGDLNFVFFIPDNDNIRFRTGTREFKLLDVSTVNGQQTSSAKVQYEAKGILETKQQTVLSIRNAHIIQEIVNENDTVTKTIERVARDTGWYDPLAQTFLVQSKGGAFLSKVDIFFATKDTKLPVTLQIREVVNGYPGKRILPFSEITLKPEQVNISNTTVAMTDGSGSNYPKYDTPTTFTFPSPIYVQDNTEYCIVLASDSNNYKVWISQMGDQIPDSSRTISEQPYAGVLFKSQNASTWTANQDQDLKFTVYRAKFDILAQGSVVFTNDVLPVKIIDPKPFETVSGTNKLRVWHRDHGMFVNSKVQFDNEDTTIYAGKTSSGGTITCSTSSTTVTGIGTLFIDDFTAANAALFRASDGKLIGIVDHLTNDTTLVLKANASTTIVTGVAYKFALPINGIPVTEIYKNTLGNTITHTITDVDLDSYVIQVDTNASITGYTGGDTVRAGNNVIYDIVQPSIQSQNFSETRCDFTLATASGKSVDGSESPYIVGDYYGVIPNDNNYLYSPAVIGSTVNEDNYIVQSILSSGKKSVYLQAAMSTTNDALSPIIDTHRTSLIAISNKINSPREDNINVAEIDNRSLFTGATGAYSFAGSTITSSNATVCALMQTISVGKYIVVSGATTSGNNGTYLVTGLAGDGATTGTITVSRTFANDESAASGTRITLKTLFVDEIAPRGSSSVNKYISKAIKLANPSNFFRIRLSTNCPSEADVLVYYKINPVGTTRDLETVNWTLTNPDVAIKKVQNGVNAFYDVDYSEDGLVPFDAIAVKIVMQSTSSSAVPRIKDLRIIACV